MTFVPNPGLEEHLLRSTEVKDHLEGLAQQIADEYVSRAPVDEGNLVDSIFGDVALTDEGFRGRVGATDWKAALVEFGTEEHSPDGSLRAAVESTGLKLEAGE